MSTFFSTLAQVNATLLGILAAAVAAMYVFLQERASRHDESIDELREGIRTQLLSLKRTWHSAYSAELPLGFIEAYQARHAGKSRLEIANQAAVDLRMNEGEIEALLNETRSKAGRAPQRGDEYWRGRVFFWILGEVEGVLTGTVGPVVIASEPLFVPFTVDGVGFGEWRRDLVSASAPSWLLFTEDVYIADFEKYVATGRSVFNYRNGFAKAQVRALTSVLEFAWQKLPEIDRQGVLKERFDVGKRMHVGWLLLLMVLSLVVGTLVPMWLSGWPPEPNKIGAAAWLVASLAFTMGATVLFVSDLSRAPSVTDRAFVAHRWAEPLKKQLEQDEHRLKTGSGVDVRVATEAIQNADSVRFPHPLRAALTDYVARVEVYNQSVPRMGEFVSAALRADPDLAPVILDSTTSGGTAITLAEFLSGDRVAEIARILEGKPMHVMIDMHGARWGRTFAVIPPFPPERAQVLSSALARVQQAIGHSDVAGQFARHREDVEQGRAALKAEIEKLAAAQ